MESIDCTYRSQASIPTEATTVFVSLELSRARWLVTSLSPNPSKISRHFVSVGDAAELLRLLSELRAKAERHVNAAVKVTCIQEIGLTGSGSIVSLRQTELKAMWSKRPLSLFRGAIGARRPTRSMESCCCAR